MALSRVNLVVGKVMSEFRFPAGFLGSRQKGNPGGRTCSAMRSGTGTLRFFYVASDHGQCDARGGLWGVAHLDCRLGRGEGILDRASGFR